MPDRVREGFTGINSVWKIPSTAMYSKNSFPGSSNELNPGRDWSRVYVLPYTYFTPFNFQHFTSQTGWETLDYQFSLGSGLKSYWCQLCSLKNSGSVQSDIETKLILPPPAPRDKLRPQFSLAAGHSVLFNVPVTWGSWRRLLVWRGLSTQEKEKHNFCCFERPWGW